MDNTDQNIPDIGQIPYATDPAPSGGAVSRQRQAAQAHRRRVRQKQLSQQNGPSPSIPNSGPPPE